METTKRDNQWVEPIGEQLVKYDEAVQARRIHDEDEHRSAFEKCQKCRKDWGREF